jgi:hypothetical protein
MDQVPMILPWRYRALNVLEDGMYGNFAGRDASRGMAKQSFDTGEFIPDISVIYH